MDNSASHIPIWGYFSCFIWWRKWQMYKCTNIGSVAHSRLESQMKWGVDGTQDWGCKSPTFPTCQSELRQTWSCSLFSASFSLFECFLFFDSSGQNISCKPNLCSGLKAEAFETEPNMEQHHFLSEEHFSSKAVTEHFHFFHFLSLALTAIAHCRCKF